MRQHLWPVIGFWCYLTPVLDVNFISFWHQSSQLTSNQFAILTLYWHKGACWIRIVSNSQNHHRQRHNKESTMAVFECVTWSLCFLNIDWEREWLRMGESEASCVSLSSPLLTQACVNCLSPVSATLPSLSFLIHTLYCALPAAVLLFLALNVYAVVLCLLCFLYVISTKGYRE